MNNRFPTMTTVLVFKTNITDPSSAETVLDYIRKHIPGSDPSLDLEDCDNVLRIEKQEGELDRQKLMGIIKKQGFEIERLP